MDQLSTGEARRIALAAQGFAEKRPTGKIDRRHLRRVVDRLGVIQLDSVNVLVRSHYLPFFSRLGAYPVEALQELAWNSHHLFEYWGHEASLLPVEQHALLRWKMQEHRTPRMTQWVTNLERAHPGYLAAVLAEVHEHGPLSAGELSDPGTKAGPWWGWAKGKRTLEYLFMTGQVTATRRPNFERVYDIPERLLPPDVLATPAPSEHDARKALLELGARALGVATASDLMDYFRLAVVASRAPLAELLEEGVLVPVQVEGWFKPAYRHRDAKLPRRVDATALLSPFDNLVWFRERDERLFDFHYRIEIYTPAPKRIYGYYVLPFLHGDTIVGRVDVKADRKAKTLIVPGAFAEPGVDVASVAHSLAGELRAMAGWLGLERVTMGRKGDLST
ncbi:MAG: winged helix-turn-helix domain-containing protein, partial [Actinobacteria bacterium]